MWYVLVFDLCALQYFAIGINYIMIVIILDEILTYV